LPLLFNFNSALLTASSLNMELNKQSSNDTAPIKAPLIAHFMDDEFER
jgi:hypothetical protein